MSTTAIMYENHLKPGYAVENGPDSMIITDSSCYRLAEETLWLVTHLPDAGERGEYFNALAALGMEYPQKIFDRLLSLGVLREAAGKKTLKSAIMRVIQPSIRLIPPKAQEKLVSCLGLNRLKNLIKPLYFLLPAALLEIVGGLIVLKTWQGGGAANGLLIFLLIALGSLIHELGHSIAAGAAGIGLRPIGLSVYLFYPVFYTNVSGMERLDIGRQLAIDCGGFIAQSAYLFLLVLLVAFTGSAACVEVVKWILLIMAFNINPLLRTDAYWIYSDLREKYNRRRWMDLLHRVYLIAFTLFSLYILWQVFSRAGRIADMLYAAYNDPETLLHEGHRIIIGLYFVIMAFMGGLRRLKEGHEEWGKLKVKREAA
jgi:hypothetical protein